MYSIPKDLKAKSEVINGVTFTDFIVVIVFAVFSYGLSNGMHAVADSWSVAFVIYNVLVAIFLILPSRWNRGKKNYQSLAFFLQSDHSVYHSIDAPGSKEVIETPILDEIMQKIDE